MSKYRYELMYVFNIAITILGKPSIILKQSSIVAHMRIGWWLFLMLLKALLVLAKFDVGQPHIWSSLHFSCCGASFTALQPATYRFYTVRCALFLTSYSCI